MVRSFYADVDGRMTRWMFTPCHTKSHSTTSFHVRNQLKFLLFPWDHRTLRCAWMTLCAEVTCRKLLVLPHGKSALAVRAWAAGSPPSVLPAASASERHPHSRLLTRLPAVCNRGYKSCACWERRAALESGLPDHGSLLIVPGGCFWPLCSALSTFSDNGDEYDC